MVSDNSASSTLFPSGAALVVGGSGGLGEGISRSLAHAGCDVALTYYSQREKSLRIAHDLEMLGRKASCHRVDLSEPISASDLIAEVLGQHGRIHTLVYSNGADISMTYVADIDPAEWVKTINIELHGFFSMIKAVLPVMREGGGGSIVAVTSAGIHRHPPLDILSVAPKASIESMIRGIAREEGRFGIRANSVAPGVIDGGLFDRLRTRVRPEVVQAMQRNTALRRFGTVDEVAKVVVFMASENASYVTGQHLCVDGGYAV